jgi:hypothetical protein
VRAASAPCPNVVQTTLLSLKQQRPSEISVQPPASSGMGQEGAFPARRLSGREGVKSRPSELGTKRLISTTASALTHSEDSQIR